MSGTEEEEDKAPKVAEEEEGNKEKDEKAPSSGKAADGRAEKDGGREGRSRDRERSRSRSRPRSRSGKKKRGDSDSESRSRSRSRKKRRSKKKHKKRKHKKRRRRSSSSSSSSDSDEAGWEKKFLATAMENAQKARMGATQGADQQGGAVPGPAAGVSGNKAIGRFFDNQGRFINPAGGFNPSGAPRRIPKEHAQWGDWECEACGGHNRKHRSSCFTCFVPKPLEPKLANHTTSVGGRRMRD